MGLGCGDVERFRGGLVFKALGLLYHSTLGSRVIKKKKRFIHYLSAEFLGNCLALLGGRGHLRFRKVDVRLPGKGDSNCHGARPVHLINTMIKWIWTSRLSIKNSLLGGRGHLQLCGV